LLGGRTQRGERRPEKGREKAGRENEPRGGAHYMGEKGGKEEKNGGGKKKVGSNRKSHMGEGGLFNLRIKSRDRDFHGEVIRSIIKCQ